MKECYLCGASERETVLYEGIYKSAGVIEICRKCYFKERIPLVNKKEVSLDKVNSRESVRERLSRMAHVNVPVHPEKRPHVSNEDIHLKDLVEKNFKREVYSEPLPPEDLIDNFNWVIMRKRRSIKVSKEKMAEDLHEPLIVIKSLEKGILPRDYKAVIKKVEGYLRINLMKKKGNLDHKDIIAESKVPTGILVSELRERAKEKKEEYLDVSNLSLDKINEVYGVPEEENTQEKDKGKNPEKKGHDKEELTDDDISKLIWGK